MLIEVLNNENPVVEPEYYKKFGNFEPIKVIRYWNLNFNLGCVVKYIARAGFKAGNEEIDDLEKALYYLTSEINTLKVERNVE